MPKTGKVCRPEGKGNQRGWVGWFIFAIHYCTGERLFPGRGPRCNDSGLSFGNKVEGYGAYSDLSLRIEICAKALIRPQPIVFIQGSKSTLTEIIPAEEMCLSKWVEEPINTIKTLTSSKGQKG